MSVLYPMKYFASISLFVSKANSSDTDIFSIPTLLIAFLEKWIFFFSISSLSIFKNCSTISYTILRKKMFFIERERERERERAQIFFFLNIFVYVSMIWDQQISFAMSKPSQLFSTSKSSLICSISFFVAVIPFLRRQF